MYRLVNIKFQTEFNDHVTTIENIEANELAAVTTAQEFMLTTIRSLNATASSVPVTVDTLLNNLNATQIELQTNGVEIIRNVSYRSNLCTL